MDIFKTTLLNFKKDKIQSNKKGERDSKEESLWAFLTKTIAILFLGN